jgi:hypothetical protein
MMRSVGIILKRINPAKPVYSILDSQDGVLLCSIVREDVCVGACIEYTLLCQRTRTAANDVELVGFPCIAQVADLLLLHRALEICTCCMPIGSSSPGVFEHIQALYDGSMAALVRSGLAKKIFLCKLFTLLGFYPQEKKFQNQFFQNLATESLDNLLPFSVSMVQEGDVEEWLRACVAMHAHEQKFKTRSLGEWVEIV